MGQPVIHLHFDHLGVDHDEAQFVRAELEEHRGDDGIDADRFARAGGTRDEAVRHGGEVADDGLAIDVLAQRKRDLLFRGAEFRVVEQLVKRDGDLLQVRDLDADGVLAGDRREDVDALGAGGAGDVCLQLRDAGNPEAGGRVDFVAGNGRSAGDVAGGDLDTEGLQRFDDRALGG